MTTIPLIIAHRGDAARHPENSMAALASALASGIRHVECDLQINASGTPVLLHDADLRRTHQCDLSVFEQVDGQGPQLPTAAEVLDLAAQYANATFFFEIKHDSIDHWGGDHVLERLQPLLAAIGRHVLIGSSAEFLAQARRAGFPSIGVILREWSEATRRQLGALDPEFLIINLRRVPNGERLWPGRWRWAVYEVGDLASAAAWGERGADFVISYNAVDIHEKRGTGSLFPGATPEPSQTAKANLSPFSYDVVVIGAGIQGAGVAQAAAAAGYRVLVLERTGVAAGTSSQSSKLIHGGLRYLETGQFRLVRESLRERARLVELAPDLVKLVPFYLPIYRHSQRRSWQIRCGLAMYQVLGGCRSGTEFETVPRNDWHQLDGLVTDDLVAVYRYFDGQTDDALLTQAVIDSAQSMGAEVRMPAEFVAAQIEEHECLVTYRDGTGADGRQHSCRCAVLVNCAGPWANQLLERIRPPQDVLQIDLVQGSHLWLTLDAPRGVYYLESPSDRRGVFAMPWYGEMLVGTTETLYDGPPEQAHTLPAETSYLLDTLAHYFPQYRGVTDGQIRKRLCGLRVLPRSGDRPFSRSREVLIEGNCRHAPRLVSVMGGKLTTYRLTAQRVMARLAPRLAPPRSLRDTAQIPLRLP